MLVRKIQVRLKQIRGLFAKLLNSTLYVLHYVNPMLLWCSSTYILVSIQFCDMYIHFFLSSYKKFELCTSTILFVFIQNSLHVHPSLLICFFYIDHYCFFTSTVFLLCSYKILSMYIQSTFLCIQNFLFVHSLFCFGHPCMYIEHDLFL